MTGRTGRTALALGAAAAVALPGCGRGGDPATPPRPAGADAAPAGTTPPRPAGATTPPAGTATPRAPSATPAPTAAERAALAERRRTEAPRFGAASASAGREAVLAALRRGVLRDARRRSRAGELDGRFREVTCEVNEEDAPTARRDPAAPVLRYDCLAISYRSPTPPGMVIGRPFLARVDFPRRRYAFCLFVPVGGEGTHAASTFAVQPSPACAAAPPR